MKKQEKTDTKRTSKLATIIKEMLNVAAQCREDAKKNIGGKLFLDNGNNEERAEIEKIFDMFTGIYSKKMLQRKNVVAAYIPVSFNKRDNYLLLCEDGFYWFKNYTDDTAKLPYTFCVEWGDFVIAEVLHKYSSNCDEYINYFWLNNGQRNSVVLGDCFDDAEAKTKDKKKKQAEIENAAYFVTHLINKLKDVDVADNIKPPTEKVARMKDIIKSVKDGTDAELGGELYLRGNIPEKRLNSVLRYFKKMAEPETDSEKELMQNEKIRKENIVALYLSTETANKMKCFNRLLFTDKGLYYDAAGKFMLDGFVPWKKIRNVIKTPNTNTFERKKITLLLNGKVLDRKRINLFIPARCEEAVDKFFVPVLKQLSAAVKENAEK